MAGRSKIKVFVGSSRESLNVARGIKACLEEETEVLVWDEDLFEPGGYTLDQLLRLAASSDFAVLVWSADDEVISRGQHRSSPRDNILFEAGLFYGALGKERVFLFVQAEDEPKIPSDLHGLTVINYHRPADERYRAAVSTPCLRVAQLMRRLGPRLKAPAEGEEALRSATFYANLDEARDAIKRACKDSPTIRILSNKGLVFFGLDESIVSLAEADDYRGLKRLRVILLAPDSRWINRGLMALRQHESVSDFKRELGNSHSIVEAGMRSFARHIGLHRSGIKYHHVEPYFRMVITDEVAFVSSYAEHPTIQVRDLPVFRFQNEQGSLYGAFKRHFNDLWHNASKEGEYIQDTTETEVSAGGILVARDAGRLYVALVMRDDGSWVLPKGHKERADESLGAAAVREVTEEIGLRAEDMTIVKSLDNYTYDETATHFGSRKVVYMFLMQLNAEGLLGLTPDPDHVEARWWPLDEPLPYMFYVYQKALIAQVIQNEYGSAVAFA